MASPRDDDEPVADLAEEAEVADQEETGTGDAGEVEGEEQGEESDEYEEEYEGEEDEDEDEGAQPSGLTALLLANSKAPVAQEEEEEEEEDDDDEEYVEEPSNTQAPVTESKKRPIEDVAPEDEAETNGKKVKT